MNISSSKSNWNGISFIFQNIFFFREGNHFSPRRPNQFAVTKSKSSAYCRVYHFIKFSTFNVSTFFFYIQGWSFKSSSYLLNIFLIYTHFVVGGKGLKNAYFDPSTMQNLTSSKQNTFSDQKHRNIKICCYFSDLSAQPINEICLFSVLTVYNTR